MLPLAVALIWKGMCRRVAQQRLSAFWSFVRSAWPQGSSSLALFLAFAIAATHDYPRLESRALEGRILSLAEELAIRRGY